VKLSSRVSACGAILGALVGVGCAGADDSGAPAGPRRDAAQTDPNDGGGEPVDADEAPQPQDSPQSSAPGVGQDKDFEIEPAPAPASDAAQVQCVSVLPAMAVGREEVDAALCFGLTYPAAFDCLFSQTDDVTRCANEAAQYVVTWAADPLAIGVPSGRLGRVSDEVGGAFRALVYRIEEGSYIVEWGNGILGKCSSEVDNFCLYSPPAN